MYYLTESIIVAFKCTALKDEGLTKWILNILVPVTWHCMAAHDS